MRPVFCKIITMNFSIKNQNNSNIYKTKHKNTIFKGYFVYFHHRKGI